MGKPLTAPMMDARCSFTHIGNEEPNVKAKEDREDQINRNRPNGAEHVEVATCAEATHYGYDSSEKTNWRARSNAKPLTVTRSKAK